jgi:hypothetical protein
MLNVKVTTGETAGARGPFPSAATTFVAGEFDRGPATAVLIRSMAQLTLTFGPPTAVSAKAYNAIQTVLAIGESQCYVARVTDNTAVTAKLVLKDAGAKPTIIVAAKTPGTDGNNLQVEVIINGAEYTIKVIGPEGVLETSPKFTTQAQGIEWSATSAWVTLTASAEAGFTTNIPAALVAKSLAGGLDANDLTEASFVATLAAFPKALGSGQVICPGKTGATVHNGMALHCRENNRFAWFDLADAPSAATLIAAKALEAALLGYGGFHSSSAIIPGLTPGTTRTVAGSAVLAGLCALVAKAGNNSVAPSGTDWPIPYILGLTNQFTEPEAELLQEAGINPFVEENGVFCLQGFYTGLSRTVDAIFWQATAARERMALASEGEEIVGRYRRKLLGGRKSSIPKLQMELQNLIKEHWESGALFGDTVEEAGTVNVGEPVNTPKSLQAGELNGELVVKIVDFADRVGLKLVTAPTSEPL